MTMDELYATLPFSRENIERCTAILVKEGFAVYVGDRMKVSS